MADLDTHEQAFLDLAAIARPEHVASVHVGGAADRGLDLGSTAVDLRSITEGPLDPIALASVPRSVIGLDRVGVSRDLLLHTASSSVRLLGDAQSVPLEGPRSGWLVRASAGRVLAHVASDDGEWALRIEEGNVETFVLVPSLDVPTIDHLLDGVPREPWLEAAARRAATATSLVRRVAAAGLLARLWSPPADQASALLERRLAGTLPSPSDRVREWSSALGPDALQALDRRATRALERLQGALAGVDEDEPAPSAIELVVRGRDDLESLVRVLELGGLTPDLRGDLRSFDRDARSKLSPHLAHLEPTPLVVAVSWQEPLAWWGHAG